jgi:hypothetical protein
MRNIYWLVVLTFAVAFAVGANAEQIDWQQVDAAFGRKPAVTDDVHRYGFPRTDLSVTLDGVTIKPALALGGCGKGRKVLRSDRRPRDRQGCEVRTDH